MLVSSGGAWNHRAVCCLAAVLVAAGLCVSAPSAGLAAPATAGSLGASPTRAIAGEYVHLRGRLPAHRTRTVVLERARGRTWVSVARQHTSGTGRFAFTTRARATSTTYRVVALRTSASAAVWTPRRTVRTVPETAALALPGVAVIGQRVTATGTFTPARPGRKVTLQRRTGTSWTVDATGVETSRGTTSFAVTRSSAGTYRYRVVALRSNGARAVASVPEQIVASASATGGGFIAAVSADHRYFLDQHGNPVMLRGDTNWGIVFNAGRWGGTWKSDIDQYVAARAAQGFNTIYVAALGNTVNGGAYDTGATWDGISPWVNGSTTSIGPDVGSLNNAYWTRVDYLLKSAQAAGITVMLDIIYGDDIWENGRPGAMSSDGTLPTDAQMTTYGQQLGTRYRSAPNLVWMIGGDYFGNADSKVALTLNAIRAAGAHQLISVENYDHSASYSTGLGNTYAQWSDVYSYAPTYLWCEQAWTHNPSIPVAWVDGYYDQNSGSDNDLLYRQEVGWALTSGSRGNVYGAEGVWDWGSGALTTAQHLYPAARQMIAAWNAVSALPEWYRLAPDIGSTTLLAGDRGTKITSDVTYTSPTNDYITGSITPDGTLALVYLPLGGTAQVTWSHMAPSGRTAQWLDPTTGALTTIPGGPASSYTPPHSNAAGGPDWYLVLRAS